MGRSRRRRRIIGAGGGRLADSGSEPSGPGPARSREALASLILIAAATLLVYLNTFHASFHLDDAGSIVGNESLRDLHRQWPPSGPRSLGYLSFAINHWIGGLDPFGYHVVNVLIHVCNGLLVFWLTATTLRTPALRDAEAGPLLRRYLPLTAGLLFAVHPIATQAVTYVVQRFASLATLFYLLSLCLYAHAGLALERDRPSRARAALLLVLSLATAVAAMRTKEISFTLPLVAAGYDLLLFRRRRKLVLAALGAATALAVLGIAVFRGTLLPALAETSDIPRYAYFLTELRVLVTYLRLLLTPIGQNVDHDFALSHRLGDPGVLLALAILAAIAAAGVLLLVRGRRSNRAAGVLAFAGIAWFFATSAIESSVIPIRDVIFEHRVYLPSVGTALALSTALLSAVESLRLRAPPALQAAAALLLTAGPLGIAAFERNHVWKDEVTLWSDAAAKSPKKVRPHNFLGAALLERGAAREAAAEFQAVVKIDPWSSEGHNNLGNAYKALGQWDDAVREYREAIRLALERSERRDRSGAARPESRDLDEAMHLEREPVDLASGLAAAHYNLASAYDAQGRLDDALGEYREAIRLAPGNARAHVNLGADCEAKGLLDDAEREYREAIRLDPAAPEAHNDLGGVLLKRGRAAEAVEEARRSLELRPRLDTLFNLAFAYEAAGRTAEAMALYQRLVDQAAGASPERAEAARTRLARLRAASGAAPR